MRCMAWKTLGPEGFPLLKFVVQSENPGTCFFSTPGFPILSHEYRPCFSVNRTPAEFCPTDPYWYNPAGVKDCTQTIDVPLAATDDFEPIGWFGKGEIPFDIWRFTDVQLSLKVPSGNLLHSY